MLFMKRLFAIVLAMMTLTGVMALADTPAKPKLVQRSKVLDAALSMLEEGNPFLNAYNNITRAQVKPVFKYGLPYFFGGKHYMQTENGDLLLFDKAPKYAKRVCWQEAGFYHQGSVYLYGLDCSGFTQWVYEQAGWPKHDTLEAMIIQHGKYGEKNHVFSSNPGKEMPPFNQLASKLKVGDLLVAKKNARHVMMFIGTLREFGYNEKTAPEFKDYLDYPLVIHSGGNPDYGKRMQKFLDENKDDLYYWKVNVPDGGVNVSIIGVPPKAAPHHGQANGVDYDWFELPDGTKVTIWDMAPCTSFCWFRINGI